MPKHPNPKSVSPAGCEPGVNTAPSLRGPLPRWKSLFQQGVGGKLDLMQQLEGTEGGGLTLAWRGRLEQKEERGFQVLQH